MPGYADFDFEIATINSVKRFCVNTYKTDKSASGWIYTNATANQWVHIALHF